MRSALYAGELSHARASPVRHRFVHPIYMLALDLDELPELGRSVRLFGYNRARPVALRDRDYHDAAGPGVRAAIRSYLERQGARHDGSIVLLTHARVFGYVFNPVSFFYCLDGGPVVAEVNNTFGDGHRYLVRSDAPIDKLLHVSPFLDLRCRYRFRFLGAPGDDVLEVRMDTIRNDESILVARLSLRRRPLTDATLAAALVRYPLMTAQVTARIHWEAFRLWAKGAPFRRAPLYDPEAARRMHAREVRPAAAGHASAERHEAREASGPGGAVAVAPRPPDAPAS